MDGIGMQLRRWYNQWCYLKMCPRPQLVYWSWSNVSVPRDDHAPLHDVVVPQPGCRGPCITHVVEERTATMSKPKLYRRMMVMNLVMTIDNWLLFIHRKQFKVFIMWWFWWWLLCVSALAIKWCIVKVVSISQFSGCSWWPLWPFKILTMGPFW